ncbi:unnamed protein product [Effrenium voratum]|nr:unnamed protein product [Effrenium voratum]
MATATVTVIGAELRQSPRESEPRAPDAERMPARSSLLLVLYFAMLTNVNVVITIPTAHDYAERLGADNMFAGLMIGLVPLCAIIGSLANNELMRVLPLKTVWVVLCLGNVVGCVLYALAGLMRFKWTLLFARGLGGLCSCFNIPGLYISLTVGTKRRSEVLFYYAAMLTFGCAVGPALAAILEVFMKFTKINNLVLDSDTIPGWFMAMVYLLFAVKALILLEEPPTLRKSNLPQRGASHNSVGSRSSGGSDDSQKSRVTWQQAAACCACFWHLCVGSAVNTGVEVYAVNTLQQVLGWSISSSALFVAVIMLLCGLFNASLGRLLRLVPCSDSKGLVAGDASACLACVLLFHFDVHAVSGQICLMALGLLLVLIVCCLLRAFAMSIATKVVPDSFTQTVATWGALAMSLGRGGGALVGAALDVDSFAPVLLCLFASTFMVGLASRQHMKTEHKAS